MRSRPARGKRDAKPVNRGGRGCSVCENERREEIDASLRAKVPLRELAKKFGVSTASLSRHNAVHVAASLVVVRHASATSDGTEVEQLEELLRVTRGVVAAAELGGRPSLVLLGVKQIAVLVERIARAKAFDNAGVIDLQKSEEWTQIRLMLMEELAADKYRELKARIVQRLLELDEPGHVPSRTRSGVNGHAGQAVP